MRLNVLKRIHPEGFPRVANPLMAGVFGTAINGTLARAIRGIVIDDNRIEILPARAESCRPLCQFGFMTLFNMLKAQRWNYPPILLAVVHREILILEKIIDLAIADNPNGPVGGSVDAVELYSDGSIQWFQRKNNCSENQD